MILRYFYDDALAQASYLVGCSKSGEALVIDPMRDIAPYLAAAQKEKLRITQVTETHIHADFVSGRRELAAATGATLYLSDLGGADWTYADADAPGVVLLRDGDCRQVGNVRIEAMHTPGHTPEHLAFVLTDRAQADRPMGVFTGDFVFVGDVGRPDLLEEAAGFAGTKEAGARAQFQSVQRFKQLPDYLQLWPGHGAGSACGKALGAIPTSTVGYEKLFNPACRFEEEEAFVRWLLDGQPEPPRYFAQMKRVNKEGPALLRTLAAPMQGTRPELDEAIRNGSLVVDFRSREEFAQAHVPGTINIATTSANYTTYVGWFVDYARPLCAVLPSLDALPVLLSDLRAIGVDNVASYFGPEVAAHETEPLHRITVEELARRLSHDERQDGPTILDVRGRSEYQERHVRGALHIPLGHLPRRLGEIPGDRPLITQCASGYRAQIAASLLQAAGLKDVAALDDESEQWAKLLPTETGGS